MAMFCAQYLSSKPFSPELKKENISEYVRSGYYGFLDYASANWWKHAKRMDRGRDTSQNVQALQSIFMFLESLGGSSTVTERGSSPEDIEALQQRITDLPDEDRDVEGTFSLEGVIRRVRTVIESMAASDPKSLGDASELYGHFSYKCYKPWCHYFIQGFGTSRKRDNHISEHERPLRCAVDGCVGQQIGFAKQSDLKKHNRRHDQADKPDFPLFPSTNLDVSLIRAAAKGSLADVQNYIEAGVDADVVNPQNQDDFPLFVAAKNGHSDVCRYLLNQGADVNAQCKKTRKTALEAAVTKDQVEITRLLIDAGANTRLRNKAGKTAIVIAVTRNDIAVISTFPTEDLEHRDCKERHCLVSNRLALPRNPRTLSEAIQKNDIDKAKIFINRGCEDLNLESGNQETTLPLHLAIRARQDENTQALLLSGRVNINRVDCTGSLPLHYACTVGNEALIRQLLPGTHDPDRRNNGGFTPFHLGLVHTPSLPVASMLLSSGEINLFNESNYEEETIAMVATITTLELMDLIFRTEPLAISRPNSRGVTPLHAAAYVLRLDMVEYILSKGDVDPNEPFQRLPPSWTSMKYEYLTGAESPMLFTPIFLAMNSMNSVNLTYGQCNSRSLVQHSITKAILSARKVDMPGWLNEDEQAILGNFVRECCNGELVTDLVNAGLSYLPWKVCTWMDDEHVYVSGLNETQQIVLTHDTVLKAICGGRCRFLDVAKENFALAIAVLRSGRVPFGSLNFDGAKEFLELMQRMGRVEDLQAAIRLGFHYRYGSP